MKRRLLALSAFVALTTGTTFGQQEKLLTHFIYDKMSINPGSTGMGMNEGVCGTMIYRNQWDKVNGAPNSAVLNVEANLSRWIPGGLGLSFYHDAIGFSRQNNLLLNYSYPIDIPGAGTLGIGAGLGMINMGIDPQWVPPTSATDPLLPGTVSNTNLDLNFGLYWKGRGDKYYVGISSTHLSQADLTTLNYTSARHYFLIGGYKQPVSPQGVLDAQVMMRTDMVKFSSDINVRYIHNNKLYGGLTYRTSDAVALMLGFNPIMDAKNSMTVGYSYDLTINKLSSISRGTHEIVFKYCYFLPPPPVQKSKHPRWL